MPTVDAAVLGLCAARQYATELAITPVHLNRVCQAVAGKTASQIVQNHLVTEAERYLKQTDFLVSEIAYLLDFDNLSYFAWLFKKHLGVSPKGFRKSATIAISND